ncbi:MAG: LysM domain-containing protein [Planctomycetota bacterium]|nr:LysM domain-containing protein [Planctomycetota bacterium]
MASEDNKGPVKARIINRDYAGGDRDVEVLFNPNRYRIWKRAFWQEHKVLLSDLPRIEFITGERRSLEVELIVDTSVERRDVREETDRIESLARIDPDLHRPPYLLFSWASLQFEGVLEEIDSRYILFDRDGTPLRAALRLIFAERNPVDEEDENPLQSPDRAKRRVIRQGDSLPLIAYQEYQDPAEWRRIAVANDITDPQDLSPGRIILVPPIRCRRSM